MAIKVKSNGAYADIVGVFHKRAGAYEAVQGVYAKAGGVYGRVDFKVEPALAVSRTDGVGPLGVVFDATATTASSGDAFNDLLYFFDFGNSSAGTYEYGLLAGQTNDRYMGGPIAAHVYETPGSYTATLWVYDGSKIWGPVTQAITVADPDVVYAGTLTTVVSTDGDFTGAPSGAVQVTSSDFDAQGTLMTSNRRVLFKRGQTFDASASVIRQNGTVNLTVGAFGPGSDYATVRAVTNNITILQGLANAGNPANNMNNWRVFGLHFTCDAVATGVVGFNTNVLLGTDPLLFDKGFTTLYKCKASAVLMCFQLTGIANVMGKCVVENVNRGVAQNGGGGFFSSSLYKSAVYDSAIDNNLGGEHCIRINAGKSYAVISTEVKRPAENQKQLLTLRGGIFTASDVNVTHNLLDGRENPVGNSQLVQLGTLEVINKLLFSSNLLFSSIGSGSLCSANGTGSKVVNNVFVTPVGNTNATTALMTLSGQCVGVEVSDNTFVYSASNSFNAIVTISGASGNVIKNNIAYAPGASGTPSVLSDAGTGTITANNSTNSQVKNTDPLFNGALTSMAGFKLQTGSPYKNAGGNFKNWIDGLGYLRQVGGQFDAGALNSVDKQTDAWSLIG